MQDIGATQSFFDLGGNSLLALRLFTRVNRMLGCDLPVATLFAGATVRHMAEAIAEQKRADPAPASVVPLQPHGSLPPLFLVHAADRNVMGYVNLVRYLGTDQPAFGVRDLGDMSRPVAQIASEHVAAIRAVQPRGPYSLVGWSFGGTVAFEMALQLEQAGEAVAFVGLLDTISPRLWLEWSWAREVDVVVGMAREAAELSRRPFSLDPGELEGLASDEQIARAVEALHAQGAVPADYDAGVLRTSCRTIWDRIESASTYDPGRFSGTVTLFRASTPSERHRAFFASRAGEEHALGWSPLSERPVQVNMVPGTHATIGAEPHARVFARELRDALHAARHEAGARAAAGCTEPAEAVAA